MKKLALLAGALLCAAAGPTKEQLKAVDAVLARAETDVETLETAARGRESGTGCPPGLTVRGLADDLRGRKLAVTMGGDLPEENGAKRDWQVYHICRALAASDPAICAEADAIASKGGQYSGAAPMAATYRTNCEVAYHQSRAVAASLRRDPRFLEICRDAVAHLAPFKNAAAVDSVCRAWQDDKGGAHEGLVAAIGAGLERPMTKDYLLGAARELAADAAYCPKLANDYLAATCRELDDYRRALASSDPSKCRGGLCRVWTGAGASACDEYAKSFMRVACEKTYAVEFATDSRASFDFYAGQAEKTLDALDAAASGAAELEAVGSRLDRLYALRARFDKAVRSYAPLSATAAAAGAPPPKKSSGAHSASATTH